MSTFDIFAPIRRWNASQVGRHDFMILRIVSPRLSKLHCQATYCRKRESLGSPATLNQRNCRYSDFSTPAQLILNIAVTPSSQHGGGVNVCNADGSVTFVSDSVDADVWWSLGSRNAGD